MRLESSDRGDGGVDYPFISPGNRSCASPLIRATPWYPGHWGDWLEGLGDGLASAILVAGNE